VSAECRTASYFMDKVNSKRLILPDEDALNIGRNNAKEERIRCGGHENLNLVE